MSAYKIVTVEFKSKELLLKALSELGLEPQEAAEGETLPLYGYKGDKRKESAQILVTRQRLNQKLTGASNDLGFTYNPDTGNWDMTVSDYDVKCGVPARISQAYAKCAFEEVLVEERFETVEFDDSAISTRRGGEVRILVKKVVG